MSTESTVPDDQRPPVDRADHTDIDARPRLLFYCQHAVGLGHLARSLALAEALTPDFHVVLLNGGRLPAGTRVPAGVEVVNLPPLGHDEAFELVSHDDAVPVAQAVAVRPGLLIDALRRHRPSVVLVELFPFGRKKFAFELVPFLEAIEAMGADRPRVVCSLRDILVGQRRDQAAHDERAALRTNRWFDAVLVHADPAFATLEESFRPATPLAVPVHYTGFVAPPPPVTVGDGARLDRVIVSAGGGMVGGPLLRAARAAHPRLAAAGLRTLLVAGPFLPDDEWAELAASARPEEGLDVVRSVDDLCREIRSSAVTVSQCGYNTTMDVLRARTPAVVVPYAEGREDEQRRRAERLERLGLLRSVPADGLTGDTLADAVLERWGNGPAPLTLDLDGRTGTARILRALTSGVAVASAGATR